jgi:hypothetical protein
MVETKFKIELLDETEDAKRIKSILLRTCAHVAILDWLEDVTGTREGHDKRIVDLMRATKDGAACVNG